jgi:hypothetical protein
MKKIKRKPSVVVIKLRTGLVPLAEAHMGWELNWNESYTYHESYDDCVKHAMTLDAQGEVYGK